MFLATEFPDAKWRKAKASQSGGSCVRAAAVTHPHTGEARVAVGDTKDPNGAVLLFTAAEWHAFADGAGKGEFSDLI